MSYANSPHSSLARLTMVLFLFLIATSVLAAGHEQRDKQIAQILELSGINHEFDQLPALMQAQMQQQPPPMVPEDLDKLSHILSEAFSPEKTLKAMKEALVAHYEAEHFAQLVKLLQHPLVKKMTALEKAASTPAAWQQMMQQANVFMAGVSKKRVALLREIDDATEATKLALVFQIRSFQLMVKAINPLMPEAQRMTQAQMETISRKMREQGLYPARQQTLLQMAWAYQEASDSDLQSYLEIYQSKLGKWSISLIEQASATVFDQAMEEINTHIKQQIIKDHAV